GIRHPLRQLRHHGAPLGAFHPMPARDLRKRSAASEAEAGPGIDDTDCDARRFLGHSASKRVFMAPAQASCSHVPVPALMIGLFRGRLFSSVALTLMFSGCSGGASSVTGASADITRSGGKVTITSVPMRSFDFSVNVPPCRSIRLLAIGRP